MVGREAPASIDTTPYLFGIEDMAWVTPLEYGPIRKFTLSSVRSRS